MAGKNSFHLAAPAYSSLWLMSNNEILDGPDYPLISVSDLIEKYPEELRPFVKRRRVETQETDHRYETDENFRAAGKETEQRKNGGTGSDFRYELDTHANGHRSVVDGRSVEAQRAITEVTIREYFAAPDYKLSRDNLCPRVSNRLLYLKIVEQCLIEGVEVAALAFEGKTVDNRWILDIGTGASLIYPILSTKIHVKNRLLASECNPTSMAYAELNVLPRLLFKDRIDLIEVKRCDTVFPEKSILKLMPDNESLLYAVCNPPFYQDPGDLERRSAAKITAQQDELKAIDSELYYKDGGEVGFLKAYIRQSQHAAENHACFHSTWFTCQVGILADVKEVQRFCEGKIRLSVLPIPLNTRRWIVAWNFNPSIGAFTQGSRNSKPRLPREVFKRLRDKLNELKCIHAKFKYKIIEAASGNVYLAVNEAVWLRKVRRSMKSTDANLFEKRIVVIMNSSSGPQGNTFHPSTVINTTDFDLVTIANGLASVLGLAWFTREPRPQI